MIMQVPVVILHRLHPFRLEYTGAGYFLLSECILILPGDGSCCTTGQSIFNETGIGSVSWEGCRILVMLPVIASGITAMDTLLPGTTSIACPGEGKPTIAAVKSQKFVLIVYL
jgi:hypothetical protein